MSTKNKELLLLILVFGVVGGGLVRDSQGVDSITWMNIYRVSDFDDLAKIGHYVENLMVPIPVCLSLAACRRGPEPRFFGSKLAILGAKTLS